jgi:hypothetical protein
MSQQFEQREEQLGKKDFAIFQYEEIVKNLEQQLKIEEQEVTTPYFEPVSSPEVDSLLNIFLRLNARLLNVSSRIDFAECLNLDETEAFKEKEEEILTLKGELDSRSDQVEKLVEESEGYHKAIRDLESKVKELVKDNESLKASNTKKK